MVDKVTVTAPGGPPLDQGELLPRRHSERVMHETVIRDTVWVEAVRAEQTAVISVDQGVRQQLKAPPPIIGIGTAPATMLP